MSRKPRKKTLPPLSLRLTEDERKLLEREAGNSSLSSLIRGRVFGKEVSKRKRQSRMPVKDQESLAQTLGLLGQSRIANNLNQLAKDANCGALVLDEDTEAKINEAYAYVISMRNQLIRALGLIEEGDQ